jgi:AcrR family transcriptional regulator
MPSKILMLESQRRDAILNAALKEFATKGYCEASTNIIAKEAGISKGLMFHYVSSKENLFFIVYDYFTAMMNNEYFELMNYDERDIFERIRQSYLLQLELIKKYPWIFELNKLFADSNPDVIKKKLAEKYKSDQTSCFEHMFDFIDESNFKDDLDKEKCKQFILWLNIGFTSQILEEVRNSENNELDYDRIVAIIDDNLNELRKIFYK